MCYGTAPRSIQTRPHLLFCLARYGELNRLAGRQKFLCKCNTQPDVRPNKQHEYGRYRSKLHRTECELQATKIYLYIDILFNFESALLQRVNTAITIFWPNI